MRRGGCEVHVLGWGGLGCIGVWVVSHGRSGEGFF